MKNLIKLAEFAKKQVVNLTYWRLLRICLTANSRNDNGIILQI